MRHAYFFHAIFGICLAGFYVLAGAADAEPTEGQSIFPSIRPGIDGSAILPPGRSLPPAEERLRKLFAKSGVRYPPAAAVLAAFKEERALDLYAKDRRGPWELIHRYKILGASGVAGPKLREGDRQVPEGLYKISGLNGASSYHRALRLNYPNGFDRRMAAAEQRTELGGDIEIHGGIGSIGCLAMGDPSIEELYELVETMGRKSVTVVISPFDMRLKANKELPSEPGWTKMLYENIHALLHEFPPPPQDKSNVEARE